MSDAKNPLPDATTTARPAMLAQPQSYPYVLTVVEGPDRDQTVTLSAQDPAPLLLGKSAACEMRLTDPSVSRRHSSLEVISKRLRIKDLGSTNGTYVNGVAIMEAWLAGGEMLKVGGTTLRVDRGEPRPGTELPRETRFGNTLGGSDSMRRLYPLCRRLAASDVTVIIEGETGTGKEQLAESIHAESARADHPFVVFDCTAVAPSLIESELFGHEKGAFTGSVATHHGVFERADGGTLLIDEVGDLPLELQPKLLRVIERLEMTRVGGKAAVRVNVRVLIATRRDLDRMVQLGRFRDDLFHRLAVARIELPPLRTRRGDVALLARHFWREFGGSESAIPAELLRAWDDYAWPGNVRELRNSVARRLALGELSELPDMPVEKSTTGAVHSVSPQGDPIAAVLALDLPLSDARQRLFDEFEQRYVDRMLALHGGNVTRAAAAAGVARRHFQRLKAKSREQDKDPDKDADSDFEPDE